MARKASPFSRFYSCIYILPHPGVGQVLLFTASETCLYDSWSRSARVSERNFQPHPTARHLHSVPFMSSPMSTMCSFLLLTAPSLYCQGFCEQFQQFHPILPRQSFWDQFLPVRHEGS